MKFSLRTFAQLLSLTGLIVVSAVEALRPGTIGAAVNLGLVVLFASLVFMTKKSRSAS